jgi:hypothetical protein
MQFRELSNVVPATSVPAVRTHSLAPLLVKILTFAPVFVDSQTSHLRFVFIK